MPRYMSCALLLALLAPAVLCQTQSEVKYSRDPFTDKRRLALELSAPITDLLPVNATISVLCAPSNDYASIIFAGVLPGAQAAKADPGSVGVDWHVDEHPVITTKGSGAKGSPHGLGFFVLVPSEVMLDSSPVKNDLSPASELKDKTDELWKKMQHGSSLVVRLAASGDRNVAFDLVAVREDLIDFRSRCEAEMESEYTPQ